MSSNSTNHSTKRKPTTNLDDSSDPSDNSALCIPEGKRLRASEWKRQELGDVGVHFAQNPTPLSDLLDKLKSQKGTRVTMPGFTEHLIKFTKEVLPFSLNDINWNKDISICYDREREAMGQIQEVQRNLVDFAERSEGEIPFSADKLAKRLLHRWFEDTFDFLIEVKEMLQKLNNPNLSHGVSMEDTTILKDSAFTHLFMKFTEIFFLKPEVSENKTVLKIRNKVVGCVPDIGFYEHDGERHRARLLVMLTEVKRDALKKSATEEEDSNLPRIESYLKSGVTGQIGIQLVSECWNSTFCPNTLGIICMSTKIMFVYLEINPEQYEALTKNKDLKEKTSYIQYSKPYDIMKKEDRDQLIDILFWLGCVQKQNFHSYYLM
ncbi:uncharacterized protein LOC127701678 [Mytilus californianus]|uniref:uncharacterized protein LOC127701678 n=1 Tax=Mytilus californianus TaxID=6549 RepID=UPI0022466F7D|nr:uncharacterized protein LOC127701678 [Mytilus californianus]